MSVEDVPAVVHIKTLKVRFIPHKFSTGLAVGMVEKKKSVANQFSILKSLQSSISAQPAGLLSHPFQPDNSPTDFRISQLRFAKSPLRFGKSVWGPGPVYT